MRASASISLWLLALSMATPLAGGCDWRDIDKDKIGTPVLSVGAPSKFGTDGDFGRIVVPIAAPSETDGVVSRFVVSGVSGTGLALVELNAAGRPTTTNVSSPVFNGTHPLKGYPLTAVAEIPGSKPGQILAAAKELDVEGSIIYTISLGASHEGSVFIYSISEPFLGIGVAAADLKLGGAEPEYLVATADVLHVYVDGNPAMPLTWGLGAGGDTCPLSLPGGSDPKKIPLSRPILVGHFMGAGTAPQIVMSNFGSPTVGSPPVMGTVSFFGIDAQNQLSCLGTITGSEQLFGKSMAMGDFNGDLVPDLIVGAPPSKAYVFFGPLTSMSPGVPLPPDQAAAVNYGQAVGAINLEGVGPDQAIVGDPDAAVSGTLGAGSAQLFTFTGQVPTRGMLLTAHDPSSNASYGATVNGIAFCGMKCGAGAAPRLPLVGAGDRVLTYFTLGKTDLRKP